MRGSLLIQIFQTANSAVIARSDSDEAIQTFIVEEFWIASLRSQ
jgi:hypothetical protein